MKNTLKSWIISGCTAGATLALVSIGLSQPANAGKFTRITTKGEETSIWYTGTIVSGDAAKLQRVINSRWRSRGVATLRIWVDLDGGEVLESMKVADIMTNMGMDIVVGKEAACISACLNLYVGAVKRWFTPTSYIGVHAALSYGQGELGSGQGKETMGSRSATLSIAEIWASYNVPAGIIVKMLSTNGHDITWLKANDLVENNWSTLVQ